MVSFQCHACGDVVKKPKLDQHHARCYTGFDCIDCQTTFDTPAAYKKHTSCVTEAEKYQKSLYKGPKANGASGVTLHSSSQKAQSQVTTGQPHKGPRGMASGLERSARVTNPYRRPQPDRRWSRNEGTGANGTPVLGTPKMSPVTQTPTSLSDSEAIPTATATAGASAAALSTASDKDKAKKRRSLNDREQAEAAADIVTPPAKKMKVTAAKDTSVDAKQTGKQNGVAGQADVQDPADQKKKKKRKSSTSADGSGKPAAASEGPASDKAEKHGDDKKLKKKKKKEKTALNTPAGAPSDVDKAVDRSDKRDPALIPPAQGTTKDAEGTESKNKKKRKVVAEDTQSVPAAQTAGESKRKSEKKQALHSDTQGQAEGGVSRRIEKDAGSKRASLSDKKAKKSTIKDGKAKNPPVLVGEGGSEKSQQPVRDNSQAARHTLTPSSPTAAVSKRDVSAKSKSKPSAPSTSSTSNSSGEDDEGLSDPSYNSPSQRQCQAIERAQSLETDLGDERLLDLIDLFQSDVKFADTYLAIRAEGLRKAWVEKRLRGLSGGTQLTS